jgi:hypothetical protein
MRRAFSRAPLYDQAAAGNKAKTRPFKGQVFAGGFIQRLKKSVGEHPVVFLNVVEKCETLSNPQSPAASITEYLFVASSSWAFFMRSISRYL